MHPQLEAERFNPCMSLIEALEKCHRAEFYKRAFGLCNNEKEALSKCLHSTRLSGAELMIKSNREKRKKTEEVWKKMEEEEYGEDAVLKKLLERQLDLKRKSGPSS